MRRKRRPPKSRLQIEAKGNALEFQELALDLDSVGEAGQGSGGTDDPMAWDDEGDGVGGVGSPDRTRGVGISDLFCEVSVGSNRAERDLGEDAPDPMLKFRSLRREGDGEMLTLPRDVLKNFLIGLGCPVGHAFAFEGREPEAY